jgi:molecular chaperone GrpE
VKEKEKSDKMEELEDRLLRLQAEFENFRKRNAKEQEMLAENSNAELLSKLLPVVDELGLAVEHSKDDGVKMVYMNLMSTLGKQGLEEMDSLGKQFDPYYHDALKQEVGEEGKILEIVQKGYLFKGKVLRHAKVVVGNGNADKNTKNEGDGK